MVYHVDAQQALAATERTALYEQLQRKLRGGERVVGVAEVDALHQLVVLERHRVDAHRAVVVVLAYVVVDGEVALAIHKRL